MAKIMMLLADGFEAVEASVFYGCVGMERDGRWRRDGAGNGWFA